MAKKEVKGYKESVERLEEILEKMQNGEMDIDELAANVKEASELLANCKSKLTVTNETVEKLIKGLDS